MKKVVIIIIAVLLVGTIGLVGVNMLGNTHDKENDFVPEAVEINDEIATSEDPEASDAENLFTEPDTSFSVDKQDIAEEAHMTDEEIEYQSQHLTPEAHDRYADRQPAEEIPVRGTGGAGGPSVSDENTLNAIDTDLFKGDAKKFVENFYTYDAKTLGNGGYKRSWAGMVSYNENMASILLISRFDDLWSANCSTYDEMYSRAYDVIPGEPYISHITHDNTIAVNVKFKVDSTQGIPPELDWEIRHVFQNEACVYFTSSGQVVDIRLQTSDIIS